MWADILVCSWLLERVIEGLKRGCWEDISDLLRSICRLPNLGVFGQRDFEDVVVHKLFTYYMLWFQVFCEQTEFGLERRGALDAGGFSGGF